MGMGVCERTFRERLLCFRMTWEGRWSCHLLEGREAYFITFETQDMSVRTCQ